LIREESHRAGRPVRQREKRLRPPEKTGRMRPFGLAKRRVNERIAINRKLFVCRAGKNKNNRNNYDKNR
jgi:hypothetical protein